MNELLLLELLYDALRSPQGVVVETNNAEALRMKLYPLRKDNMAEFSDLAFVLSPVPESTDLWILKKTLSLETL